MIAETALICLSLNIFHEARGEPIMGQYAVALVTLNRATHKPDRVCKEVFKPSQFSWTIGNAERIDAGWKLTGSMKPRDAHAWWVATRVAATALEGKMPDFTHGSKFYHAKHVAPRWRLAMVPTRTIGNHHFYSQPS